MKHTVKKLFATFLSIAMIFSICLMPAYAADNDGQKTRAISPQNGAVLATLAYSDENTEVYYIPISDPVSRSIYNLEVSLTGDKSTKTVTATVKNTMALGFSTIDIELALYSERTSTELRDVAYDNDLNLFESLTVSHSGVTESAKYYAVVTGVANGQDIYYSTNSIPFNKKAEKYPTNISSPVTGQSLPYNFSMTMAKVPEANRVVWNASKRAAYAKYLGVDLTDYDVHHIIPREYGGTNDYSNLIPLAVSDHRTVTSWWVNY